MQILTPSDHVDRLTQLQTQYASARKIDGMVESDPVGAVILAAGDRGLNYDDPYISRTSRHLTYDPTLRTLDRIYYELYRRNAWVRACADKISQEVTKRKFRVMWNSEENHPTAVEVRKWFDRLGGDCSMEELVEDALRDVLVYGKGFLAFRNDDVDGELGEVYRLDARITDPVIDKRNQLLYYRQDWKGEDIDFALDEVIYMYVKGPAPYKPSSMLFSLLFAASMDVAADRFNLAFFRNATNVGMVFSSTAPPNTVNRNREYLKERYSNPENAFTPLVMEGDSSLVRDGTAVIKDISFSGLTSVAREKICAVYNTPQSELGISEDVNRNVKQGNMQSWHETCIWPWQEYICRVLTERLCWDKLGVPDLEIAHPSRTRYISKEEAEVSASIARRGATINEIRAVTHHSPVDGGEQLVVFIDGVGYVPLELPLTGPMEIRREGQGVPNEEMPEDSGGGRPRVQESTVWMPADHNLMPPPDNGGSGDRDTPGWVVTEADVRRVVEEIQNDSTLRDRIES